MPRPLRCSNKDRRLGHLCRSITKTSPIDHRTLKNGRSPRFTLPPVYYEEESIARRCDSLKGLRRKKSLTKTNHFDQRNIDSYSSLEESSDDELCLTKQYATTEECPDDSDSSGRARNFSSGECRQIPRFLRLSDSRKLTRNRCMRQPKKWVRTCYRPVSSPRSSRIRLIVAEEMTASYNHLFSQDDDLEPYDPETYKDSCYLTIPKPLDGRWRRSSLDRISEFSQTSSSSLLGANSPSSTMDITASQFESSVEFPAYSPSDGLQLTPSPARSRLFRPECGDRDTRNIERSASLCSALKTIRRHSRAVAKFVAAAEKKKTETVPPMVYENLECIQQKLQETRQLVSEICTGPPQKILDIKEKTGEFSKSANAVIEFLQSTIAKSVEILKHLETVDSLVCRRILSEASSILSELERESTTQEPANTQTSRSTEESSDEESDETPQLAESSLSGREMWSQRQLPRRRSHKFYCSRRRRCGYDYSIDNSIPTILPPPDTQRISTGYLSCHRKYACYYPRRNMMSNNILMYRGSDRAKSIPFGDRLVPPKPVPPDILSRKQSFHRPPKRMRYTPLLPNVKPHYHMCSCDRPHRLPTTNVYNVGRETVRDPLSPESNIKAVHPRYVRDYSRLLNYNLGVAVPRNNTANSRRIGYRQARYTADSGRMTDYNQECYKTRHYHQAYPPSFAHHSEVYFNTEEIPTPVSNHHLIGTPRKSYGYFDNSCRRLPTCLARRRLKYQRARALAPSPEIPVQQVYSETYSSDKGTQIRQRRPGHDFGCPLGCYHRAGASRCRHQLDSCLSMSSIQRSRSGRPKVRKGRSDIVIRSDYFEDSDSDSSTSQSKTSDGKDYNVVLKCAQINVYVDNEKETREQCQASIDREPKDRSDATTQAESCEKAQSCEKVELCEKSDQNALSIFDKKYPKSEKNVNESRLSVSDHGDVGYLTYDEDFHDKFSSFSRTTLVIPKTGVSLDLPKNPRTHFLTNERNDFDKIESPNRLARPADASRTESSSESSDDYMSETKESSCSSSPESDWSSESSSCKDLQKVPEENQKQCYFMDDTTSGQSGRPLCTTDTSAPRPLRRWLVLGSEWTPSSQDIPVRAVFDTPSQTAPLVCVKGNDFRCGTMPNKKLRTKATNQLPSKVAFPQDVSCSYTSSGHRIESCVASYVFARPGSRGLPVPLEASIVPPDDEEISKLSFQRMGSVSQGSKTPPKPLVVFPQSVDSVLSPSGHHLESCFARFVFLNEETIVKKSSSGSKEQLDTCSPSRTFVILPFFRATPFKQEEK